jgi:hypothetical protein
MGDYVLYNQLVAEMNANWSNYPLRYEEDNNKEDQAKRNNLGLGW